MLANLMASGLDVFRRGDQRQELVKPIAECLYILLDFKEIKSLRLLGKTEAVEKDVVSVETLLHVTTHESV